MRLIPILLWTVLPGCAAVTTTPLNAPQTFNRDEFGYPELPPEQFQSSVKLMPPEIPEVTETGMPPLVKTVRRALKSVEESGDPEFIEERKKKKIPSRFVVYQGIDPYQKVESGQDTISMYALSLARNNRIAVSREQEPVDGSSFVRKVLYSTHVGMLPRGAEKQARALATSSFFENVAFDDLQPGDLIFWSGLSENTVPGTPAHVGIFVGEKTAVTQWPGRGVQKLLLEGVLAPPQFLRAYRFRPMGDAYRTSAAMEARPKAAKTRSD